MALSWWDIPGPCRFVRRIENDLRDRVNVVAALPAGLGREWFDFFRRRWAADQERIDVLRTTEESSSPLDELCSSFTTHPSGTLTLGALGKETGFRGRTVGLFLDSKKPVQEWVEFLVSYEQECRLIDGFDRTVFLLATDGVSPQLLPSPETYLRIHVYDGYARPHDCHMYAWVMLGTDGKQGWRTELKMALCAQLAQWDHRLCEVLCERDIGSIMQQNSSTKPISVGQVSGAAMDVDEAWALGILQRRDGQIIYHSGWMAEDNMPKEFRRRVWAAQVQVIFPLIEQVRRQAIERYGGRIRLPILVGENEYVNDPYELEIAMVRRIVSRIDGVPRTVLRRLDQAWEFRNALAHLEPLTEQQLQAFEPSLDS
jgi:hypothetical protein